MGYGTVKKMAHVQWRWTWAESHTGPRFTESQNNCWLYLSVTPLLCESQTVIRLDCFIHHCRAENSTCLSVRLIFLMLELRLYRLSMWEYCGSRWTGICKISLKDILYDQESWWRLSLRTVMGSVLFLGSWVFTWRGIYILRVHTNYTWWGFLRLLPDSVSLNLTVLSQKQMK